VVSTSFELIPPARRSTDEVHLQSTTPPAAGFTTARKVPGSITVCRS
jgi:hypothetical protein